MSQFRSMYLAGPDMPLSHLEGNQCRSLPRPLHWAPAAMGARYFGASVPRREDPRLLLGAGRYVDDVVRPGLVHVAFLRSPHAHARIVALDTAQARAVAGVV